MTAATKASHPESARDRRSDARVGAVAVIALFGIPIAVPMASGGAHGPVRLVVAAVLIAAVAGALGYQLLRLWQDAGRRPSRASAATLSAAGVIIAVFASGPIVQGGRSDLPIGAALAAVALCVGGCAIRNGVMSSRRSRATSVERLSSGS